ncbi:MAG: hypothetical protein ACREM8_01030 [Vulcanimicrobiaceae bacterium]
MSRLVSSSALAGALLLAFIAGCSSQNHGSPAQLTDAITKAVYANDYAATTANFDDQAKSQVTRSSLGDLSDRMHRLGAYQSLAQKNAEPDKGRYAFELTFDKGTAMAELRIDPDGKVGAYRVAFPAAPAK